MMKRLLFTACMFLMLLSACHSSDDSSPVPGTVEVEESIPAEIATQASFQPTHTASPQNLTVTPVAASSPVPEISPGHGLGILEEKSYLLIGEESWPYIKLAYINEKTREIRVLSLPMGFLDPSDPMQCISPNGRFYAYHSGSIDESFSPSGEAQDEIWLNVLSIETGEMLCSVSLLSDSYPDNFLEAVKSVPESAFTDFIFNSQDEIASSLRQAFLAGISSLDWSPDSTRLAFAGQMEGLSSDLYVLEIVDCSVRRLSRGPEEIQRISFSPDGSWIMHASAYWIGMGTPLTNHAASIDGRSVISFPTNMGEFSSGWLDPRRYLVNEGANGIGSYGLKILDISSSLVVEVWPESFGNYTYDSALDEFMIATFDVLNTGPEPGIYRVSPGGFPGDRVGEWPLVIMKSIPGIPGKSLASSEKDGTFYLIDNGDVQGIDDQEFFFVISGSSKYAALYGNQYTVGDGLLLLDLNTDEKYQIGRGNIDYAFWSKNDDLLYYLKNDHLYFLDADTRLTEELPLEFSVPYFFYIHFESVLVE